MNSKNVINAPGGVWAWAEEHEVGFRGEKHQRTHFHLVTSKIPLQYFVLI